MMQIKNVRNFSVSVGAVLVLVIAALFVSGVFAEGKHHFGQNGHDDEMEEVIHAAFENGDYTTYMTASTEKHRQSLMTEEEFDRRVAMLEKKRQISDAFADDDYDAYRQVTDGSIRQLSEMAFYKKSSMLTLKEELKAAIQNRDFDLFTQKQSELEDLLADEYMRHGRDKEAMTEEQFNALADRTEDRGDGRFAGYKRGGHGMSSCNRYDESNNW